MANVIHGRTVRYLVLVGIAALAAVSLVGCGNNGGSSPAQKSIVATATVDGAKTTTATASALGMVDRATRVVKDMTPGAVLVGVQTPSPALVLPPARWDYLFADSKRNKIIVIEMSPDSTGSPTEAGNSKLTAKEYARVAPVSEWKVDSDQAYESATALYKKTFKEDPPGTVSMGLVLIKPASATAVGAKALQWEVYYFPANGDTNKSVRISVDAVTGKAFMAPTAKT
jgi:hypothetical protein